MKPSTSRAFALRRRAHTRAPGPESLSLGSLGVATRIVRAALLAFGISALVSHAAFADEKKSKDVLASQLGKKVTLSGEAQHRGKLGAALLGKDFDIWIEGLPYWPNEMQGKRVSVTGTVIERHDLPVFIPNRKYPGVQGIPVPKGTDLHKASHRYLLKDATWKLQ
jgi:hypothetical protein